MILLNTIRLNGESEELVDSVVNLSIRYGIITPYTSFLIEEDDILSERGRQAAMDDFTEEAEALAGESTGADAVSAADTSLNMQNANAPLPQSTMPAGQVGAGSVPAEEPTDMDMTDDGEGFTEAGLMDENRRQEINPVRTVGEKTFLLQGDIWTDTTYEPDSMEPVEIVFLSDAYFDLLEQFPQAGEYFAIGEQVIVVLDGTAYQVIPEA